MLYFITGNANKFSEAKAILGTDAVEQLVIELDEIQSLDPHVVIEHKIKQAVQYMSDSTFPDDARFFVEDVSVSFDAMSGFPGTMIKRCIESMGVREIPRLLVDYHDKGATALCSLGYRDGQQTHFMEGHIHGQIVSPRTDRGFGRDLIFMPDGYDQTFAEMDQSLKDSISTRYLALQELKKIL